MEIDIKPSQLIFTLGNNVAQIQTQQTIDYGAVIVF